MSDEQTGPVPQQPPTVPLPQPPQPPPPAPGPPAGHPVQGPPPGAYPPGYAPHAPRPVWGPPGSAQGYPPNGDERMWALLCHASFFVLSVIGPLIVMLTRGKDSPYVRRQAVEALNFHLSLLIYMIVSFVLVFVLVGIVTLLVTVVFGLVMTIVAMVAANRGEDYRYPLCIRMVS